MWMRIFGVLSSLFTRRRKKEVKGSTYPMR